MHSGRRRFLRTSLALLLGGAGYAGTGALGNGQAPPSPPPSPLPPDDYSLPHRPLGATGLSCSLLGIGTGTNGFGGRSRQTELGRRPLVSLLQYAHDRGITYFDLADGYGSHQYMRDALASGGGTIPREKAFVLTKTHAQDAHKMRADLDRFRRELNTEYLDVVLLHCKFSGNWPEECRGAMDVLSEAKEKEIIRAHGVSCHSLKALRAAAAEPWVEVDLARLNPWGRHMDADVETVKAVLQKMRSARKGVIGMKIMAQGEAHTPEQRHQAIEHALGCGLLDCFTIGVQSRTELDQLLAEMAATS